MVANQSFLLDYGFANGEPFADLKGFVETWSDNDHYLFFTQNNEKEILICRVRDRLLLEEEDEERQRDESWLKIATALDECERKSNTSVLGLKQLVREALGYAGFRFRLFQTCPLEIFVFETEKVRSNVFRYTLKKYYFKREGYSSFEKNYIGKGGFEETSFRLYSLNKVFQVDESDGDFQPLYLPVNQEEGVSDTLAKLLFSPSDRQHTGIAHYVGQFPERLSISNILGDYSLVRAKDHLGDLVDNRINNIWEDIYSSVMNGFSKNNNDNLTISLSDDDWIVIEY